ncbi:MAG: aldehyde dehydrogenase family protein, partial [Betaproteobacteria bacterium]|nr:aldehyde dehydrogenase family protein [Betaproteobacteria bacterium]
MPQVEQFIQDHQLDAMRIGGRKVGAGRDRFIEVFNPYTEQRLGTVPKATLEEVREAYAIAHAYKPKLSRFDRAAILNKAAALVREHLDDIANLISAEAG